MKLKDEFKGYPKETMYSVYCSIVYQPKDYEKITRNKMLEEILKEENQEGYIYYLLTSRELEFLKYSLNNKISEKDLFNYSWEIKTLNEKCIFSCITFEIFEEQRENVILAIKKYENNVKLKKNGDRFYTLLIGIVRTYGTILSDVVSGVLSEFFKFDDFEKVLLNPLAHYYCDTDYEYIPSIEQEKEHVFYRRYWEILDDLDDARKIFGVAVTKEFDINEYIDMFYYGFPIKKPSVKKMFNALKMDGFCNPETNYIEEARVLNERTLVGMLNDEKTAKIINDALDDTPCAAMNGATPKEHKKEIHDDFNLSKHFKNEKQIGANLSEKDADLFYKLYFALLEYVNNRYNVVPNIKKIYNQKFLDPKMLSEINECFIEHKDIISDFVYENPYNFSKEELKIVDGFKTTISDKNFIVCGFDKNYTHIYSNTNKKTYMVKGIRANLDEILNNRDLPFFVSTTLLNFKNTIIYNGMISVIPLSFGSDFKNLLISEVSQAKKCYTM